MLNRTLKEVDPAVGQIKRRGPVVHAVCSGELPQIILLTGQHVVASLIAPLQRLLFVGVVF